MKAFAQLAPAVAAILALTVVGGARAGGDAEAGATVFKKCATCHSLEAGKIKVGPPLHGVLGRKSGSVDGFRYSKAMKASDVVWSAETLDKYLAAPRTFVPGNRMPFAGLKDAKDREDVIAYIKKMSGGN